MTFLEALKRSFVGDKNKKVIHMDLDPDSVKENNTIKGLANENAALKGELAKLRTVLGQLREQKSDKEEEAEVKEHLNKEGAQISSESQGKFFSLGNFFKTLYASNGRNKFNRNLQITTWDRSHKLAKFADFGFSEDGDFVLLGKVDGKVKTIMRTRSLMDMMQSVGGLGNDIETYKIPVNLDEQGRFIENFMSYEAPELIRQGSKLVYAKARKKPVFDIIAGLNEEISALRGEIEEAELMNQEQAKKIEEIEKEANLSVNLMENSRSESTKAHDRISNLDKIFRDVEKDLAHLRTVHAIDQDNNRKLEEELQIALKQAQTARTTEHFEDALTKIDNVRDVLKHAPKDRVIVQQPPQQPPQQQ